MEVVFLGLGSNLGDGMDRFHGAVKGLAPDFSVRRASSVYETAPEGGPPQPNYLNMVVEGRTRLEPDDLLRRIHHVERAAGRVRSVRDGPRTLDVDILFFGRRIIQTPSLTIPHPRWALRGFVLEPLLEIAAGWVDPRTGRTVARIAREVDRSGGILERMPPPSFPGVGP